MEIQFSVHARAPQMGDTLVWMGDGWEPQSPYARAQRETHVHTTTIPQINMGLTRSPNFVSGSAGWQIEADGSAEFNDVVVRGTIYASAGEIAGWTIASGHLYAGTGAGRVGLRPVDYPFYAGAENPAAAPFRVTAAGALVATSATITGTITATSGTIGGWDITATQIQATGDVVLLDSAGIITVGGAGYLTSNPFTSGTQGWRITPTEAEFGNITARGEIRTAVFKYGEIHAQAGQLLVTPNAAKLDEDLTIAASGSFNVGEAGRFGVNDIVRLKDGTGDVWLKVTADNGDGTYNYSRQSGSVAGTVFRAGTAVVGYGASGEGGIVLDAVTANGPFIDIFTHAGAPWTTLTTKVRVGNLAGIVDADLNPTGYGFYSDNAYLKGDLVAGGGKVIIDNTGVHIDIEGALPSSGRVIFEDFDATYDFWAMLWTYASGSAYKFSLRNRAATATYTTATTSLTAEGPAATVETVSEVYLSTSGWSGLRSAAGTYAVVGVWDGPATVVRPKTTWNSGGNIVHKLFDAAGANKIVIQDSSEVEVAYVDSNGNASFAAQLKLSGSGSTLGLLCGTDVQWYRMSANLWRTPDSVTVDTGLNVGSATSAATGEIRLSADARVGAGLWVGSTASDPDDNDVHIDGSVNASTALGCRVYRDSAQTIAHNTLTALSFSDEVNDTDLTGWAIGDPTKLYARHAGYYMAGGGVGWAAFNGIRKLSCLVEYQGTTYLADSEFVLAENQISVLLVTTGMFYMAAGEYIRIIVYQNSGGNLDTIAGSATGQHVANGWLVRIA